MRKTPAVIGPRAGSALNVAAKVIALTALALGCATVPPAPPAPAEPSAEAPAQPQPAGSAETKDAIRRAVRSHAAETQLCYERRLAASPGLAGKVTLSWTLLADGTVGEAKVLADSTTLLDEEVHRCLRAAVEGWSFPERSGKVTKVTYPFVFRE